MKKGLQNRVEETFLHDRISSGPPSQSPKCGTEICQGVTLYYKHLTSDCFKRNHLMFLILMIPVFSSFDSTMSRRSFKKRTWMFSYFIEKNLSNFRGSS